MASPVAFGTGDPEQDQKNVVDPAVNGELTSHSQPLVTLFFLKNQHEIFTS